DPESSPGAGARGKRAPGLRGVRRAGRSNPPRGRRRHVGSDRPRMRIQAERGGRTPGHRLVLRPRITRRPRLRDRVNLLNRLVVTTLPLAPKTIVRSIASRYVAGESLAYALATVRALNAESCMATLDVLGEDIVRLEETEPT